MKNKKKIVIGIIGLGYVGLPLAIEFSKKFETIGFDTSKKRVNELINKVDNNNQISVKQMINNNVCFTYNDKILRKVNFFIITVPSPVYKNNSPNNTKIRNAAITISKYLKKGDIIVLESTVYPSFTETFLKDVLEKNSSLKYNTDFFLGYSPERINPGDTKHSLANITKIVSSNNKKTLNKIKYIYGKILSKKIHITKNIKIAEAAKVIENTQRDLNIALMNELSIIFDKLNIDIKDVLKASLTKWNFINFIPGLVGGHCISVDPYYLTYISKKHSYIPQLILSGRKVNDNYHNFVLSRFKKNLITKKINIKSSKILILGLTYKKNVKDIRNSKIFLIVDNLIKNNINFKISDPIINKNSMPQKYKKYFINYHYLENIKFSAILISSNHKQININFLKKISNKKYHIEYVY